ncbi:hypothetical protein [Roseovarius sp. MMSF_3281]|uniref:hypothetical protein n=1 Tax=Roseovarius sp. MMSF_3281 TaxID=3046694 RepID=UPI00273F8D44|nr:hypothetical protein [Roseovarius sp. MMSF_3281]
MHYFITATLTAASICIAANTALAQDFKRIKTKSEYTSQVAGKRLVADFGWVKATADGGITGQVNGQPASGNWTWNRGFWCRDITFGDTTLPRNCQAIFVKGNTLVSIRDKGQGDQVVMKFQ